MPSPRGCFKSGCFGCLGILAVFVLIGGVTALLAWNDVRSSDPRDEILEPLATDSGFLMAGHSGRVILNLGQSGFEITRGQPGDGLRVEAVYDNAIYDLEQLFTTLPDSSWQFELDFRQTGSGLRAILQSALSKGPSTQIHIFLPPDVPLELVVDFSKGDLNADLGGLWLKSADIHLRQGGFVLEFSEPTKEPVSRLKVDFSMGGGSLENVGNASPGVLDISCSFGGAEVHLDGAWINDCDVSVASRFGGIGVIIPRDVKYASSADKPSMAGGTSGEGAEPVLWMHTKAQYGDVDIIH